MTFFIKICCKGTKNISHVQINKFTFENYIYFTFVNYPIRYFFRLNAFKSQNNYPYKAYIIILLLYIICDCLLIICGLCTLYTPYRTLHDQPPIKVVEVLNYHFALFIYLIDFLFIILYNYIHLFVLSLVSASAVRLGCCLYVTWRVIIFFIRELYSCICLCLLV